ncbi:centromere protein j [Anaeramoeba flamelloides]|uniref:Centromere protein j n=1 Tax=Anaeramoeba flamelloides TaxID=1746091 RepID=A0AAV7ZM99_9EUKA|nr:centromere protein j [Anaeramoeba flamelloides]
MSNKPSYTALHSNSDDEHKIKPKIKTNTQQQNVSQGQQPQQQQFMLKNTVPLYVISPNGTNLYNQIPQPYPILFQPQQQQQQQQQPQQSQQFLYQQQQPQQPQQQQQQYLFQQQQLPIRQQKENDFYLQQKRLLAQAKKNRQKKNLQEESSSDTDFDDDYLDNNTNPYGEGPIRLLPINNNYNSFDIENQSLLPNNYGNTLIPTIKPPEDPREYENWLKERMYKFKYMEWLKKSKKIYTRNCCMFTCMLIVSLLIFTASMLLMFVGVHNIYKNQYYDDDYYHDDYDCDPYNDENCTIPDYAENKNFFKKMKFKLAKHPFKQHHDDHLHRFHFNHHRHLFKSDQETDHDNNNSNGNENEIEINYHLPYHNNKFQGEQKKKINNIMAEMKKRRGREEWEEGEERGRRERKEREEVEEGEERGRREEGWGREERGRRGRGRGRGRGRRRGRGDIENENQKRRMRHSKKYNYENIKKFIKNLHKKDRHRPHYGNNKHHKHAENLQNTQNEIITIKDTNNNHHHKHDHHDVNHNDYNDYYHDHDHHDNDNDYHDNRNDSRQGSFGFGLFLIILSCSLMFFFSIFLIIGGIKVVFKAILNYDNDRMNTASPLKFKDLFSAFKEGKQPFLGVMGIILIKVLLVVPCVFFPPFVLISNYLNFVWFWAIFFWVANHSKFNLSRAFGISRLLIHRRVFGTLWLLIVIGLLYLIGLIPFGFGLIIVIPLSLVFIGVAYSEIFGLPNVKLTQDLVIFDRMKNL